MKRNNHYAFSLSAVLALCVFLAGFAPAARAQTAPAPASTPPTSQKVIKVHFIVEHMMYQSLQVHSVDNFRDLRTFSYSPQIRDQMQQILNAGGYQYGDKVTIWYGSDTTLALKIRGKPSKAK